MKRIFLTAILLSSFSLLFAGKGVNLDPLKFNYALHQLPTSPLELKQMSYSVAVKSNPGVRRFISDAEIIEKVNIEGLQKLQEKGFLRVSIIVKDFVIIANRVDERVVTTKNKGVETKTYYYRPVVDYGIPVGYNVTNANGAVVASEVAREGYGLVKNTWRGPDEYSSFSAANNYFSNNRDNISSKLITEEVNALLSKANGVINAKFGYPVISSNDIFWTINDKKHEENDDFSKNCREAADVLSRMDANIPPTANLLEDLKSNIAYFESIPAKYTGDGKAERKIRYAAYFNLAKIYFFLENFDKAEENAKFLIVNDYDTKDGKRMLTSIEELKTRMALNKVVTSHFEINSSEAETFSDL